MFQLLRRGKPSSLVHHKARFRDWTRVFTCTMYFILNLQCIAFNVFSWSSVMLDPLGRFDAHAVSCLYWWWYIRCKSWENRAISLRQEQSVCTKCITPTAVPHYEGSAVAWEDPRTETECEAYDQKGDGERLKSAVHLVLSLTNALRSSKGTTRDSVPIQIFP